MNRCDVVRLQKPSTIWMLCGVSAAFQKPVAVMSADSLREREAAQRGLAAVPSSAKRAGSSEGSSMAASEHAYSVAAAAGLILETPPLRRIYSASTSPSAGAQATYDGVRGRYALFPI
jgi:hypothetical protein